MSDKISAGLSIDRQQRAEADKRTALVCEACGVQYSLCQHEAPAEVRPKGKAA
jgi:hypothetical protein